MPKQRQTLHAKMLMHMRRSIQPS
eukprot:COSAG06_NODE_46025_length_350_cov_0.685259_2_plen_23_part_01